MRLVALNQILRARADLWGTAFANFQWQPLVATIDERTMALRADLALDGLRCMASIREVWLDLTDLARHSGDARTIPVQRGGYYLEDASWHAQLVLGRHGTGAFRLDIDRTKGRPRARTNDPLLPCDDGPLAGVVHVHPFGCPDHVRQRRDGLCTPEAWLAEAWDVMETLI